MTWSLANVEERARNNASFHIPALRFRKGLKVGDVAKLVFVGEDGGERMWVLITQRLEGGRYRGTLNNSPVVFTELKFGQFIEFGPEHVADYA